MLRHYIEFDEAYFYKRLHRIEIYDADMSSGSATELIPQIPPAKLFYDSDEEELTSPIRGSRCEIYLHVDDPDQYDYFFTANKKRFKVIYYINSIVRWHGFVEPELLELPYTTPSVLTLSCTCGLAYLKDKIYSPVNSGMVTFFDVIQRCIGGNLLTQDAFSGTLTLYESVYIYATNISQSETASPLKNLYIPETIFYKNDEWLSCYDVLKQVVERLDCYIKCSRDGFYMLQINGLKGNFYLRNHNLHNGAYNSYTIANYLETFDGTNKYWLSGSQYKEILPGWESLTINQTYEVKESIFADDWTGITYADGINKDTSATGILHVDIGEIDPGSTTIESDGLYRQLIIDSYVYDAGQYLYMKLYLKEINDCSMRCRIRFVGATDEYFLKSDGTWSTTDQTFITDQDEIGYYEIETDPLPESGDLYMTWGASWPGLGAYADSYYNIDIHNSVFQIKITESEFQTEGEFVRNTNSGYSLKKEIDTSIGEILSVNNNTQIYKTGIFYLSSGVYYPVTAWTVLDAGDNATLNELIADEKAGNYAYNLVKLKGTMAINDLNSMDILQIGSVKFQIISSEFDFLNNEVYLVLLSYN